MKSPHFFVLFRLLVAARTVSAFSTCATTKKSIDSSQRCPDYHATTSTTKLLQSFSYGRGAEIWPPSNEEPIRLEHSFPGGFLPDNVVEQFQSLNPIAGSDKNNPKQDTASYDSNTTQSKTPSFRLRKYGVRGTVSRILRRAAYAQAAYAQEETEAEGATSSTFESNNTNNNNLMASLDNTPIILAVSLLRLIRPLDVLLVSFLTGYFIILFLWARSSRNNTNENMDDTATVPVLLSLPPQGHVPNMVTNPLGSSFTTYSTTYDSWLKAGALLGLLAPIILVLRYTFVAHQMECAQACARPLFIMSCQAISEAASRRALAPLPIRILIPVAYNTARLGYLWHWTFFPAAAARLGRIGRGIAFVNLAYWVTNLFGFLLPVATIRYMRAHFFAVEAEQVATRPGMEESIGLMF